MTLSTDPTQHTQPARDDTTRYLCAAAHLDSAYADGAIREFLVEPTRPVPPSPGVQAAAVLAEAVAARTRRKLRDGVLALLMVLFVIAAWGEALMLVWFSLAILVCVPALARGKGGNRSIASRVTSALAALGILVLLWMLAFDSDFGRSLDAGYSSSGRSSGDTVWEVVALVALVLMAVVLVADRWTVHRLVTTRFGRIAGRFQWGDPLAADRPLLSISPPRFVQQISRYLQQQGDAAAPATPLVVHRGFDPFVGAGIALRPWSVAVPLNRLQAKTKPDGSPFDELTTDVLYQRVVAAMQELTGSDALAPDRRLRELTITGKVFASSAELIDNVNNPAARCYLPELASPPARVLPQAEVDRLRAEPREWARFYVCFEVETWDRDLVLSTYLHAAIDHSTFYLEWTPCALAPVRAEYQAIDKLPRNSLKPLGDGLLRLLKLPASLPGRIRHTCALIRPRPHDPTVLDSDRYGSLESLRELAADSEVHNYFQLLDIQRYGKILESRLLPTVGELLRDAGFSPAEFEQRASTVVNNAVTIHGANHGAFNVGGTTSGPMSGASTRSGA